MVCIRLVVSWDLGVVGKRQRLLDYISSHADVSIKSLSDCLSHFTQWCSLDTFVPSKVSKVSSFVLLPIFFRREGPHCCFGEKSGGVGVLVNGL